MIGFLVCALLQYLLKWWLTRGKAYLFRITGGGIAKVAGLTAIDNVPNIENINVTEWVPGHMAYRAAMPRLMREVGWEVESDEFAEIEDPDPDNHEKRQRELINEIEEARRVLDEKNKAEKKGSKFAFWRKKKTEKKEWETYDENVKKGGVDTDAVEPELDPGQLEKRAEGVLFDIDAIRTEVKELAGQDFEIKQLESTLPPMRITMSRDATPEPTPPMLRSTRSQSDAVGLTSSFGATPASVSTSTFTQNRGDDYGYKSSPNTNGHNYDDNGITMSFDLSTPSKPTTSSEPERPAVKSRQTTPAPVANMDPYHNAWDDDEFGQEKEIKMTFA
jgi:hypothetical protein